MVVQDQLVDRTSGSAVDLVGEAIKSHG